MWVSTVVPFTTFSPASVFNLIVGFLHNFTHRVKSLNSPLTWVYTSFPQLNPLVTTTTYNYIKAPVRFPLFDFFTFIKNNLLQIKTCKVVQVREG